jgi:hypothetical protein
MSGSDGRSDQIFNYSCSRSLQSIAHVQLTARIRMHILASAKFGIDRLNLIIWIHSIRGSAVYIGLN